MRIRQTVQVAAAAALAATGLLKTLAADVTLTTSDTTGAISFNAAGHWSSGLAPTAGSQYFTGAHELWTPEGGTAGYTFGGSSLTISAGGKLIYAGNGAAALPVISINNWTNSGGLVSARTGANVSFDKPLVLTGSGNVLGSGSQNTNLFAGVISGAAGGGLTLGTGSGAPYVVFTNKNTFTGGSTVEAGATLQADGGTPSGSTPAVNPLGANAITLKSGSKLVLRENGYGSTTPTIIYGNDLIVQGDATLDLIRYSSGTPACQIRFGNLSIGANILTMTSSLGGHWFAQTGITTLSGDAIFNTAINTFMNKITDGAGSYKITKNGAGVLWFGDTASDFNGGIVLNTGTVEGNANGTVFGTGNITVNSGTLRLRYTNNAQVNSLAFNGTATLVLFNAADLTYNVKSLNWNAGTFTMNRESTGGTLTLNTPITNTAAVQVNVTGSTAGNIAIGGASASVTLGTNITFNPTTASLMISAPIGETGGSRTLTMTGTTNLTLSGANTYSGGTKINGGTLVFSNSTALGSSGNISFGGGTLKYATGLTTDLSGRIKSSTGAVSIDDNGQSVTFANALDSSNTGGLSKQGAGTLTLSGANTYGGGTTVNKGTLQLPGGDNVLPVFTTLNLAAASALDAGSLRLAGGSNTVGYMTFSGAGVKVITDGSLTAGTLGVTNSITVSAGTSVVERVSVFQGNADWNGLFVQNATLAVTNGAVWKGRGGVIGQNGGNRGQVVIDHATMMQDGGLYLSSFNPDRTSTVSVVNGGLLNADSLYMPWSAGPGVNGRLYGGPSQVSVSNATLAFGNIYHLFNTNGVSSEAVVTFDNATVGAYRTTGANIASSMTVRVRSGGVTFALGSGTNMTVNSALTEDSSSVGGGLRKAGAGLLTLSSTNTYSGVTSVDAGTLRLNVISNTLPAAAAVLVASNAVLDINGKVQVLASLGGGGSVINCGLMAVTNAVIPGGTNAIGTLTLAAAPAALVGWLKVDAATDGTCDQLNVQGSLDLTGLTLQVADLAGLNKNMRYIVAACTGTLTGSFVGDNLPTRWLIRYDAVAKRVSLVYNAGSVLKVL